jgi:hypothetical protein
MVKRSLIYLLVASLAISACATGPGSILFSSQNEGPCATPTPLPESEESTTTMDQEIQQGVDSGDQQASKPLSEQERNEMLDKVNQGGPALPIGDATPEPPLPGSETGPSENIDSAVEKSPATPSPTPCP